MTTQSLLGRVALVGVALTVAGCAESVAPDDHLRSGLTTLDHRAAKGGKVLFFNGVDANTSTPLGTTVTTQIDDIAVDAKVRFEGPNAFGAHQMIYYNGHGAVSGWGIIVLGAADGLPDGSIGILAGGIAIPMTPFVLTPGEWHHVSAERRGGVVTVTFDEQVYVIGPLGVNPVGGGFAAIERTSLGGDGTFDAPTGDFHGAIDKVRVRNLATDKWIERWQFNEGEGVSTTGAKGTVLFLGNTAWARKND